MSERFLFIGSEQILYKQLFFCIMGKEVLRMEEKKKTYALLGLTTIIWGIQPLCAKVLLLEWSPVTITYTRYFFVSSILLMFLYLRQDRGLLPPRSTWLSLVGMGVTGILGNNVAQFTGLQYSTVTNCTLISAMSPAITALFAALFIKERLSLLSWLGILISLSGALLVISHGRLSVIMQMSFNYGDLLFVFCQVCWTTYSLIGLKVMRKISAMAATAWAGLLGAVLTLAFCLATEPAGVVALSWFSLTAFIYMVVFGGVLAMLFWNIGIKNAGPSMTAIFQNITPVVGMLGGALLFKEIVGTVELVGALTIFAGVYLTTHSNQLSEAK